MKKIIKLDDSLVTGFLLPLSLVTERVVLSVKDDKISAVAMSPDSTILMLIEKDMQSNTDEFNINVGNIKKLKSHIDNATDLNDSDELIIEGNKAKYKSGKWRFSLMLLDDGIIRKNNTSMDTINALDYKTFFDLSYASIREIVKLRSANADAEKVYFKFTDDGVYADVADYSVSSIDESGVRIALDFDGDQNTIGCPVGFELIKLLSQHKGMDFKVKYASEKGVFVFQYVSDGTSLTYVVSEIKN
jgi:hypothetical protein